MAKQTYQRQDGKPAKEPYSPAKVKAVRQKGVRPTHPRAVDANAFSVEQGKAKFLAGLRERRNLVHAVSLSGYSRRQCYRWREEDAEFAAAWDEAWQCVVDRLEASAMERAIDGFDEPVYHQGMEVGTKKRYDPILTIFMLKKNRPEKYEDRVEITLTAEEYASQVRDALSAQDHEAKRAMSEGGGAPT